MFSIHINKLWNSSGGAQKAYPRVQVFPPIHKDGTQLVDHMSITISTHHPPPPLHHSRLWEQIDAHEIAPLERFTCQTNILAPDVKLNGIFTLQFPYLSSDPVLNCLWIYTLNLKKSYLYATILMIKIQPFLAQIKKFKIQGWIFNFQSYQRFCIMRIRFNVITIYNIGVFCFHKKN